MSTWMSGDIKLTFDKRLQENLGAAEKRFRRAASITVNSMAPRVENYMKNNAPWTDQTGNARNGLAARAYTDGDDYGIVLFHQVPYGIFLETKFGGRDAIIQPTIDAMSPEVMSRFNRLLERF